MPDDPASPEPEWTASLRAAAGRLAAERGRPCLVFHVPSIRRPTVLAVRRALAGAAGEALDVVVSSPGGDIDAAYVIARELRRRFARVAAYVPLISKSAATLLCLAADELVLGDLGELGPLDAQYDEKQTADFPVTLSRLAPFTALSQLQDGVLTFYDDAVGRILHRSGMRPFEACSKAAELTSAIYNAIYAQMDPNRLAESARGLELGCEYGSRVLRRYRPELHAREGDKLVHRLVHAYPSHGFVLDLEELAELGLPARVAATAAERAAVEALAAAILDAPEEGTLVELVARAPASPPTDGEPGTHAEPASAPARTGVNRRPSPSGAVGNRRPGDPSGRAATANGRAAAAASPRASAPDGAVVGPRAGGAGADGSTARADGRPIAADGRPGAADGTRAAADDRASPADRIPVMADEGAGPADRSRVAAHGSRARPAAPRGSRRDAGPGSPAAGRGARDRATGHRRPGTSLPDGRATSIGDGAAPPRRPWRRP